MAGAAGDGPIELHLADGRLVVLDHWQVVGGDIRGHGSAYGVERDEVARGILTLPLAGVAVVRERESKLNGAVIPMAVATAASIAGSVVCLASTKSCFGSCPTFYVPDDSGGWDLEAEGFSTSIAKILEDDDLDDLPGAKERDGAVTLAMRNEALETHMIRRLALEVVEGPPGSTVLRGFGPGYLAVGALAPPDLCSGAHVDGSEACRALSDRDATELQLASDGADLAAPTSVSLHYPAPGKRDVALVLTARNSLMSTYVLYEMIAFMGHRYAELMARIEQGDLRLLAGLAEVGSVLGDVRVSYRQGDGAWREAGALGYIGPIARATRAVEFHVDDPDAPVEIELSFARAHWKFDAARLAPVLASDLHSVEIAPEVTDPDGRDPATVEASLRGDGPYLATTPGDEIRMRFPVNVDRAHHSVGYFLRSRGFYYEWMRDEWLVAEDPARAEAYLDDPRRAFRELAGPYLKVEPTIEDVFRSSRFSAMHGETKP